MIRERKPKIEKNLKKMIKNHDKNAKFGRIDVDVNLEKYVNMNTKINAKI